MRKFKRTALSIAAALATVTASPAVNASDFSLTDSLSVTGFIDMSYVYTDADGASSTSTSGLDQFEIDLLYSFDDKLNAQVDLEYKDSKGAVALEQAFFTYAVTDEFTFKAGRFLSYSGWETEEPTGLFQYSGTGYAKHFYGYYQQGISGLYSTDGFAAALSIINSPYSPTDTNSEKPGYEAMVAVMPTDAITVKAFYLADGDTNTTNVWGSYSAGDLTLAAEYNLGDYEDGSDGSGYLFMANYAMGSAGITVRYHDYEVENADGSTKDDGSAITISPSYAVSDNLLMVFEYRMDESDVNGDSDTIALEALVSF
ncbi:phosphate-selective porin O and P [Catenovulum agarivorans DS-2]|uniref:Phosphate-selective porin O and P n=1 Tax=Catenovulum agarivorans DS-2 TaxID=1328313 RepID=W7QZU7_9ALTE|nr:outer membrane beta-barrel protein [Catenovulum agarivorans]EWH10875.1 phosphate-selective porin O and P [Catenovulum agarivorans DS-2]